MLNKNIKSTNYIGNILNYLDKEFLLFCVGGMTYYNIEVLARGFSHWTMFIVGGMCFVIIGLLNEILSWNILYQHQCLIGGTVITLLEFISGYIINIKLGWNVWDYSGRPYNLMGQICLKNSIDWIFLSGIAIILDDMLRYILFNEQFPHYIFTHKQIKTKNKNK